MGFTWVILEASVPKDALKAHPTANYDAEGFRITPSNLSELIITNLAFQESWQLKQLQKMDLKPF